MHRCIARSSRTVFVVLALTAASATLAGEYVVPVTKKVPVERLVRNLERAIASEPRNIELRINLARLHGMAYALKTEEVTAVRWRSKAEEQPYYGHDRDLIPYRSRKAATPEADALARAHLEKAIEQYEVALGLDPRNLLARLGYGWMHDQAGDKPRAIAEYRQVVKEAWVVEETAQRRLPEDRFFTHEAAGYLIQLLDPLRDAAEMADLRAKRKLIEGKKARLITPLAIPLRDKVPAHGIEAPFASVAFDADGSGVRRRWTWLSRDAGWLVYDRGRTGEITSALQWFGNVTFWLFWHNGYHALAALDDDGNGELAGDELRDLAVWHDRNSNGLAEPGEVRPLAAHAIVALSCRYMEGDGSPFAAISPEGVRLADGRTRPSYDIVLRAADVRTLTQLRAR